MATQKKAGKAKAWDDEENEATNNFFKWGDVGDYILGTLIAKKQTPSTLPDKKGELQWIYEFKVEEGLYHDLDEKGNVGDEITLEKGDIISVGGRQMYDSRMARVKIGQIAGLKFTEELPPKTRGYNPTKLIKVFTPKDDSGEFRMDAEFLAQREADEFEDDDK